MFFDVASFGRNDTVVPISQYTSPIAPPRVTLAPPRVVGLAGLAESGKSTVAAYLVKKHGYTRIRFAGPLKAAMAALGLTPEEIEGSRKELPCPLLCGKTPRFAMQRLGTEWGREAIGEDMWVNCWKRAVDTALKRGKLIVADDVRFSNESGAIWSYGGFIFQIVRPGQETIATSGHASEKFDASNVDGRIINDGTIADLQRKVDYRIVRGEAVPRAA